MANFFNYTLNYFTIAIAASIKLRILAKGGVKIVMANNAIKIRKETIIFLTFGSVVLMIIIFI